MHNVQQQTFRLFSCFIFVQCSKIYKKVQIFAQSSNSNSGGNGKIKLFNHRLSTSSIPDRLKLLRDFILVNNESQVFDGLFVLTSKLSKNDPTRILHPTSFDFGHMFDDYLVQTSSYKFLP